jgi:hypothetical protein
MRTGQQQDCRGARAGRVAVAFAFGLLALPCPPALAADDGSVGRQDSGPIPPNFVTPAVVRPLLASMWHKSPTFRRQCARLSENPSVIVQVELAGRVKHARARSRIEQHATGLTATVQIDLRNPTLYIEHIAHELEHVLEYVDGTDLPRFARQGLDGVVSEGGRYETARARAVGRAVSRETVM